MKTPMFPCKYHQNGGFSMAMLVLGRVVTITMVIISPLRIGLWDPFQMAELHGL